MSPPDAIKALLQELLDSPHLSEQARRHGIALLAKGSMGPEVTAIPRWSREQPYNLKGGYFCSGRGCTKHVAHAGKRCTSCRAAEGGMGVVSKCRRYRHRAVPACRVAA